MKSHSWVAFYTYYTMPLREKQVTADDSLVVVLVTFLVVVVVQSVRIEFWGGVFVVRA